MRTTVEFDPDTAKAIEALRREQGIGLSEAVNQLIRRALLPRPDAAPFRSIHRELGFTIDVSNVAEALDVLEGSESR
jgi:hypothetical protein